MFLLLSVGPRRTCTVDYFRFISKLTYKEGIIGLIKCIFGELNRYVYFHMTCSLNFDKE